MVDNTNRISECTTKNRQSILFYDCICIHGYKYIRLYEKNVVLLRTKKKTIKRTRREGRKLR